MWAERESALRGRPCSAVSVRHAARSEPVILALQRTAGNRAVSDLVVQTSPGGGENLRLQSSSLAQFEQVLGQVQELQRRIEYREAHEKASGKRVSLTLTNELATLTGRLHELEAQQKMFEASGESVAAAPTATVIGGVGLVPTAFSRRSAEPDEKRRADELLAGIRDALAAEMQVLFEGAAPRVASQKQTSAGYASVADSYLANSDMHRDDSASDFEQAVRLLADITRETYALGGWHV